MGKSERSGRGARRGSGWKLELGVDFGKREAVGGYGGLSLEGGGVGLRNERGAEYL